MAGINNKLRGKDTSPSDTIAFIEQLLDKAGIKTEYIPLEPTVSDCRAARVSVLDVPGRNIATNGKGLGEEFCKASAYGELMERLQNKTFFFMPIKTDPCLKEFYEIGGKPVYHIHDIEQPECTQYIRKQIAQSMKNTTALVSSEIMTDVLLEKFGSEYLDNGYPTDVFYRVGKDEFVNLPVEIICTFAGSNGMAAGNSLEEAIVQAISEIMERYAARAYIDGKYIPPEIPREYLKKYSEIYNIITEIEKNEKYRVVISDCSMGKNIPVVCGTIIDTDNNTLGIKFAAHPDMEIALERVFTEAMQGYTLETFTKSNPLSFTTEDNSEVNTFNFMKVGMGHCLPSVLLKHPSYEFVPWEDVSSLGNRELAQKMVSFAENLGGDIYISNRSFLGFPTVFIYIPGISEMTVIDSVKLREVLIQVRAHEYFRHLNDLNDEQVKELICVCRMKRNALMENTVSFMGVLPMSSDDQIVPQNALFFEAVCLYRLGDLTAAADVFASFLNQYKSNVGQATYSYASCVMNYVKAKAAGMNGNDIEDVLRAIYSKEIVEKVLYDFDDPLQVLCRAYPLCNGRKCEECDNTMCCYPHVRNLYRKLITLEAQNPSDQNAIREIFH